jgi:hypothetical protein
MHNMPPTDIEYARIHAEEAAVDVQNICSRIGVVDANGNVPQLPPPAGSTDAYLAHRAAKFVNLTLDQIDAKLADEGYPKDPAPAAAGS